MIHKESFTYLSSDEVTTIHGVCWRPEGSPLAVIHLCHGMIECIERYNEFAKYLCKQGFAVYGTDLLGHGKSVVNGRCYGHFGEKNGNWNLISDQVILQEIAKRQYPGKSYYMIGHSFGSIIVRQYMERFPDGVDGVILMGSMRYATVWAKLVRMICHMKAAINKDGYRYRSTFIHQLVTGRMENAFPNEGMRNCWLSSIPEEVQIYNERVDCDFIFTLGAYRDLLTGLIESGSMKNIAKIRQDMPILLLSGKQDPISAYGKQVKKIYHIYKKAGLDCRMRLYPDSRHEIIHDVEREQVFVDVVYWLKHTLEG